MKSFVWLLLSGVVSVSAMAAAAVAQPAPQLEDLLGQADAEEDADVLDLTEMTCRSFFKSADEDRESLMIFMHGYMSGMSGETTVDGVELAIASDDILDMCLDDPEASLFSVFQEVR
ncbi:MAG: HdeA/HdeB family chaperone [Cyanobacteria bacterium P01_H01_bin.105]